MAITSSTCQPSAGIPSQGRDLVPHEAGGVFLGWTYQIRSLFSWRTRWYFVRPDGTDGTACRSLLDALNHLRGPNFLPGLVDENE